MQNQNTEREIDLLQLCRYVLRHFRILVISGVIFGVLVGAYKYATMVKASYDEVAMDKYEAKRTADLEEYQEEVRTLTREIENLSQEYDRKLEYQQGSVLMQANPYDIYVGTAQLYVDTDYKIDPNATYQNPDYTGNVLNAYAAMATNGVLYNYILDNLSEPLELRYVKELVSVSVDYDMNMINVTVNQANQEKCEELLNLVLTCIEEHHAEVNDLVAKHSLDVTSQSVYASVDLSLDDMQNQYKLDLQELSSVIPGKKATLKTLKKPDEQPDYATYTKTQTVKFIIIGILAGAVLAAMGYAMKFVMDSSLRTAPEAAECLGMPVLGEVPMIIGSQKQVYKDRLRKNRKSRNCQYTL